MARIMIEDLSPADESLTPEELEQIEGAGRRLFRPESLSLERGRCSRSTSPRA